MLCRFELKIGADEKTNCEKSIRRLFDIISGGGGYNKFCGWVPYQADIEEEAMGKLWICFYLF